MTIKREQVGPYVILSKRAGTRGEYIAFVEDEEGHGKYVTHRYGGRGAKDRAFQDAVRWAKTKACQGRSGGKAGAEMRQSKDIPVERQCRLDGQKPTLRDKWLAFHRLWRLATKRGQTDQYAVDCFRTLWANWGWIRLLDGDQQDYPRSHYPKFLRRRLVENERRRRLHGDHPEWRERDKVVANMVRNEAGIEVTPDEVAAVRRKVINKARAKASELGIAVPPDDEDLLRFLKPGFSGEDHADDAM